MPQTTKKGPLSPEKAAEKYFMEMYDRLRCGRKWREHAVLLLQEEYLRFSAAITTGGTFGMQTMQEYYWLIYATDQYLRSRPDPAATTLFYEKAVRYLAGFNEELVRLPFDKHEKEAMREVFERMAPIIRKWDAQRARG